VILGGEFAGARVAHLTDRDLGVVMEIFSGMPGDHPCHFRRFQRGF
jgi:hypothetical protein